MKWTISQFNAQSIFNKFTEITAKIMSHQPDVVCISETWLTSNTHTGTYLVDGYTSFLIVERS